MTLDCVSGLYVLRCKYLLFVATLRTLQTIEENSTIRTSQWIQLTIIPCGDKSPNVCLTNYNCTSSDPLSLNILLDQAFLAARAGAGPARDMCMM